MDFMSGKEPAQVINEYIEHEMSEYRKVTEKDISSGNIAPEAKAAFSRKPYYATSGIGPFKRPIIR